MGDCYVECADGVRLVPIMEWAAMMKDMESRRVVVDDIAGVGRLSTVFLGLAHGRREDGAPYLYESMLFCDDENDERHQDCRRYCTRDDAARGHAEWLAELLAWMEEQR